MLIDYLILNGLGFSRKDIITEYSIDKAARKSKYNKLDYVIIIENKPKILIEAKSLGINLYEHKDQLSEYFNTILNTYDYLDKELIGILTDGDSYNFYTNNLDKTKMDEIPFYTITLSTAEDKERIKLLNYKKSSLISNKSSLVYSDEEYELYTSYRIDLINDVFRYFASKNIEVSINDITLKGRIITNLGFTSLYKNILKEVNIYNPNLLYLMASEEDIERNGKITSYKFSLQSNNAKDFKIKTTLGDVYVSIPQTRNTIIERILYLSNKSNYGNHNILISLKDK